MDRRCQVRHQPARVGDRPELDHCRAVRVAWYPRAFRHGRTDWFIRRLGGSRPPGSRFVRLPLAAISSPVERVRVDFDSLRVQALTTDVLLSAAWTGRPTWDQDRSG